jgi:2-methylisocitrate lyase-like PEP mutase family enzyme
MESVASSDLDRECEQLRALHVPRDPVLLPNAWDVSTARAVVEAGFPAVATTSHAIADTLGYEDHEAAPAEEMLGAAARIAGAVEVPVTVDAEAGYGMEPAELVGALKRIGAAGCNLEDTDHGTGELRDSDQQSEWLGTVRKAAEAEGYGLVLNARIDVFVRAAAAGGQPGGQADLVEEALRRAGAYFEAGVDCVYPIALHEAGPLREFVSGSPGPVNALKIPPAPSLDELAELGVARVSWGGGLHHQSIEQFGDTLASIAARAEPSQR